MLKYKTYAENLRMAAKTRDNAQNRPLKIREIATMSGFSYEHIRKLWQGKHDDKQKFSLSRECNDIVCGILGLDPDEMWHLAEQEKYSQRTGYIPMQLEDPEGRELRDLWEQLDKHQHLTILEIARSMCMAAQVAR